MCFSIMLNHYRNSIKYEHNLESFASKTLAILVERLFHNFEKAFFLVYSPQDNIFKSIGNLYTKGDSTVELHGKDDTAYYKIEEKNKTWLDIKLTPQEIKSCINQNYKIVNKTFCSQGLASITESDNLLFIPNFC